MYAHSDSSFYWPLIFRDPAYQHLMMFVFYLSILLNIFADAFPYMKHVYRLFACRLFSALQTQIIDI